jgi:hypothetical protein
MGFFGPLAPTTPAPPPFVPTDISGLKIWLDATTGLFDATSGGSAVATDGSAVARWEDQSGNGNHATQTTSNNRPVLKTSIQNGKNVIRFDGSNDRLSCGDVADMGSEDVMMFAVAKIASGTSAGICGKSRAAGTQGRYSLLRESGTLYGIFTDERLDGGNAPTVINDTSTSFRLLGVRSERKIAYLRIGKNASASGHSLTNQNTSDVFLVGAYQDSSGTESSIFYPLNGDICEILVYVGTFTNANVASVEDYLSTKWGL